MTRTPPTELTLQLVPGPSLDDTTLDAMLNLLQAAFPKWPLLDTSLGAREHLRWKVNGPTGWDSQLDLGWAEGRLAVGSISIAQRYLIRGHERRVRLGADTAVHPDFQGRGYDSTRRAFVSEAVDPDFDLSLGYSTNPRRNSGGRRYGESSPEPVEVLYKPLDLRRSAAEARERRGSRLPTAV